MNHNVKIYLKTLLLLWLTAILFRLVFMIWQWDALSAHTAKGITTAFYIGLRFDGRISALASVPLLIFLFTPVLGSLFGKTKFFLLGLYSFMFFFLFFIYVADFANYAYLQQRTTYETLEQLYDIKESVQMVWQTYPVIRLLLAAFIFTAIMNRILRHIFNKWQKSSGSRKKRALGFGICFILLAILIYGQYNITYYPLRWSQAYFSGYYELAALALNPLQNLYDTKPATSVASYDEEATREAYPVMADFLKVNSPDAEAVPLRYDRFATANDEKDYNVVLIVLESLSTHKSSLMFEELESTPFLKDLSQRSLYFPHYYANARTTARAMFSLISGIPDVNAAYAASTRDPSMVDQKVIWDQFEGYSKLFSLGGSANWANLRGVMTNNVTGLKIYEETFWKSPKVDVWGITDLALLLETHELLVKQKEPFFSLIQTASFHRPFTVPSDIEGFDYSIPSSDFLEQYGFIPEEYLSMRFVDFALKRFLEEAEKSPYFENTIFVITGDHGISERSPAAGANYQALSLHAYQVPLLIYAPALFPEGQVLPQSGGHTDIFPTIAGIVGIPYQNTTMGRDLLDDSFGLDRLTFVKRSDKGMPILLGANLCYSMNMEGDGELYIKAGDKPRDDWQKVENPAPEQLSYMNSLAKDIWETARYIPLFNTKRQAEVTEAKYYSEQLTP